MLTSQKERKQAAADARELLRQQIRDEKRDLRDRRYILENHTVAPADGEQFWADLWALQKEHGKEGPSEFWWSLVPKWERAQLSRGGALCPNHLKPQGAPSLTETHKRVAAALERASRNTRTLDASQVLQAWALEDGNV